MKTKEIDIELTRRALELAARGTGQVSPGPLVGCVVVDQSGNIVGEGSYFFDEVTHAEVAALEAAGENAKGGTAYISLEPHSHFGRTPPCTQALIEAGISRVVVPIEDPNPLVSGNGFAVLRAKGVKVDIGILQKEAEQQNEKFIHWHRQQRPFVHIKIAASLDGRCATKTGDSKWITGEAARARGQMLRHEYDAILIGIGTVEADDPSLTDRSGLPRHRELTRVILDNKLRINLDSEIVRTAGSVPTIVFCENDPDSVKADALRAAGIEVVRQSKGGSDLRAVLQHLRELDIQSLLVEGGPAVTGSFFDSGLVDKVSVFVAPVIIGGIGALAAVGGSGASILSDAARLRNVSTAIHDSDIEITGYPAGFRRMGEKIDSE